MPKEKTFTATNLLLALTIMLFIFSLAVVFTLNFRPLYYYDIDNLSIIKYSGLSVEEIRINYDALIDYNSIFYTGQLQFPTLPMSETGRIHFEEVKNIFVAVQILLIVTFVGSVTGCVLKLRRKKTAFLKLAAILTVAVPAVLGLLIALNWQMFFVMFHELFFNNNYWIFNAVTDPVITILPDAYFMHCALLILAIAALGATAMFITHRVLRRRKVSVSK